MLKLVKFLLHIVYIVLLGGRRRQAPFSGLADAASHLHPVGVAHLLQQSVDLRLVDGGRVDVVEGAVEFLSLDVKVLEDPFEFSNARSDLIQAIF